MESTKDLEEKLREYSCIGDEEGVRKLILQQGVNVNSQNAVNEWTALHWAAKRGHVGLTSFLLSHGADRNIHTKTGQIALDLATHPNVRSLLGDGDSVSNGVSGKSTELPIVPNYIAHPQFPHTAHDNFYEERQSRLIQKDIQPRPNVPSYSQQTSPQPTDDELVLKVRVANATETDFIEIEMDKTLLTFEALIDTMCSQLDIDRQLVTKVRKLPNTIVRKDKDVRRLVDFQELELVLSNKVLSASSRNYATPSALPIVNSNLTY
ncbi:hypothetical protein NP493_1172g00013 [Ridgeia piscesae]|uniref:Ankyrin repeat domain-containing protein 40 n=1 Tax=Ridgeia piscesae TaxID=27915 RepID=A0AAD9KDR1_RIDPI|nr:hypothetical protein NP493_1172g00013 [Ridgeia piscesae]